ncbi:MAG TPA: 6,7-dimethyl-8-ribityllumazine synthase [Bacteroidota bacterium]|nr:6,7-dimethyl-8-ribityllumazine synthase [Bacteroidota bacterium]
MNTPKLSYRKLQGTFAKFRIAIIQSQFNHNITDKLLEGAEACLRAHTIPQKNVEIFICPGAFELPQVANRLAASKRWDAIICLGAVIRGETPHFEYVSAETARGIQDVALKYSVPVVMGVLTTDNERQALDRVGGVQGHKGWDAALTAMEMASLFQSLKKKHR